MPSDTPPIVLTFGLSDPTGGSGLQADLMTLAQFEHRGRHCASNVLSDHGSSTVIQYSCGGAGFGRTQIDVITPRSLRISTQGISDGLPFNYVLQARRIDDCPKNTAFTRH